MSEIVELRENELEMVAGAQGLNISLQENINVTPQTAVSIAVLSPDANVIASNVATSAQANTALRS